MADSRDTKVWTKHAEEQWEENKTGHQFNDGDRFRVMLKSVPNVAKVLDLGCGGSLWRHLFDGYDYTGVDQNENMISFAKKRFPNDKYFISPGEKLPLEDESFDLVFTAAVLQHNLHPRKADVVKEIYRVLKPNGHYFCTENTFRLDNCHHTFGNKPWNPHMDDGYSFTSMGWEWFMKQYGFEQVWFQEPSEYLYKKVNK